MQESLSLQSQSSAVQHPLSNQVLAKPQLQVFASLGEGEGVTFSPDINGVESRGLSLQEVERHLAWRQGYLVFTGEPLSLVVEELNRYQVISIEIADATLSEMPIGGRFKVGELEALLDALASNFGIQVSRIDEQHIQLLPK
jgi:transmembrane sensor